MRILFVTHHYGGGTERHVADLRALLAPEVAVEVLRPDGAGGVVLEDAGGRRARFTAEHRVVLDSVLAQRAYGRIHFHHIHGHAPAILDLPARLGVAYDITLHDFHPICPQYALVTTSGEYCGEPDEAGCAACIAARPHAWGLTIAQWRARMHGFLRGAARVVAPSQAVRARIAAHFPDIDMIVLGHPPRAEWLAPPRPHAKVLLMGGLAPIKGLDTVVACARDAQTGGLPLAFEVLGFAGHAVPVWPELPIRILGEYDDADLPLLATLSRADVVWFPGRIPESYSYTLDVALSAGLPVVATDIGAIAERLGHAAGARLLPLDAPTRVWNEALLAAAGLNAQPGPSPVISADRLAARNAYRAFLLAPWADVDGRLHLAPAPALPVPAIANPPAPAGQPFPLAVLYEHGVECGHRESRLALRGRLDDVERSEALLAQYSAAFGKPWYEVLNDVNGERGRWHQRVLRLIGISRRRGHALASSRAVAAQRQGMIEAQQATITAHVATIDAHRVTIDTHLATIADRQSNIEALCREVEARQADLAAERGRIAALEASLSWRITAPLRAINARRRAALSWVKEKLGRGRA